MSPEPESLRQSKAGSLTRVGTELFLSLQPSSARLETALLRLIPSVDELRAATSFEIDLSEVPVFYPSSVSPICAWFLANRAAMSHLTMRVVRPQDDGAASWLEKVGFFDLLKEGATRPQDHALTMALHSIDPADRASTEGAIEHISNLLRRHAAGFAGDVLHSTQVALAEVIENASKHARLTTPAFVCGQYHPSTHKFSLCVADCGIGIRESFRIAPYEVARDRLLSGENPLDLAIEPLMSSKYGMGHSGYGLFYASELCALAAGTFVLSSDTGTLIATPQSRRLVTHGHWQGTVVNLLLDTTAPVSGAKIWAKLPSDTDDDDWLTTFLPAAEPPFIAMWRSGTRLYTRDAARELRQNVKDGVLGGAAISLEHITTITPSFADEFFRVLFEEIGEERYRKCVRVTGASDYAKRLIELVLKNRPSSRGKS